MRPLYDGLHLDEPGSGYLALAVVAERLSRIGDSTSVAVDEYLGEVCSDLLSRFGGHGNLNISCVASNESWPIGAAVILGRIVEELVWSAVALDFEEVPAGRVAVLLRAGGENWQLHVENSGVARCAKPEDREKGLLVARLLTLQLGGLLEANMNVIGGNRHRVTIPRARNGASFCCRAANLHDDESSFLTVQEAASSVFNVD